MADIGEPLKHVELEPIPEQTPAPATTPAPAVQPEPVPA